MKEPSAIISAEFNIPRIHIEAVLALLEEGATIPFISRYRKEATGGLDEVAIFNISQRADSLKELADRKSYILQTIDSQGKLTDELKKRIEETYDPTVLEDIYLPFKPKRRTRAQIARENGLEPLAKIIMAQNTPDPVNAAKRFLNNKITDEDAAISGASDIIAEWFNENETARNIVRNRFKRSAVISSKVIKGKEEEAGNYQNYFNSTEPLNRCSSHRYLAMRRGEAEGFLRVSIDIDDDEIMPRLYRIMVKPNSSEPCREIIEKAIADGYKRLMRPSIETETAAEAKIKADDNAIQTFTANLHQLLLSAPLGAKRTMGVDPGFRTGCKIVCLDANGNLLHHDVIFPTAPRNDFAGSSRKIYYLVKKFRIEAIAIGNGTASRETERFLKGLDYESPIEIFVVSENGASIYSASKIARDEFPDKDVTVRGAVSIGRRLMDPLAELVKIDPKSIGVGQYQHDVDQTKLKRSLDMTVETCVNSVGVNLNTASRQLLAYVSGIGDALAGKIVDFRAENGDFHSREDLKRVPRLGAKAFEQCAGFLRVPESENILDNTAVHPERYELVARIAKDSGHPLKELVSNPALLKEINLEKYITDDLGLPTLNDILHELEKPGRDPREKATAFEFDDTIHDIEDLQPGMILPGIVNNITDFGAFVDIGIHHSGLIHISQMAEKRVRSASDVVKLHQNVMVKVLSVDLKRNRVALTLRGVEQK